MGTLEKLCFKVKRLLSEVLKVDADQESLSNIPDAGGSGIAKLCTDLSAFFKEECPPPVDDPQSTVQSATQDVSQKQDQKDTALLHVACVKAIVNDLAHEKDPLQAQLIVQVLHYLALNNIISAECVCFELLAHENLKPDNATYWVGSFKLIKLIIPGVYYKGVREIMKKCLEKARLLPAHLKHSRLEPANALCDLLETIFDRNASLLPGYFIVNVLLNDYPDYKTWPHWRLSRMLTNFIDECRKTTQMLSITGRHRLRPIVEHSGHSSSSICSWKLDSTTLKFPLKGALPYSKNLQESQTSLLKHVFRQPYSKEMILAMLDLVKKQRYLVLEEQIVDLFVESLEECATSDANYFANAAASNAVVQSSNTDSNSNSSGGIPSANGDSSTPPTSLPPTLLTPPHCQCSHVTSLLIYFVLNQQIMFKSIFQALHDRFKKSSKIPGGRDHLMWSLLQFLPGTIAKNPVSDFQPVLRLIELLYPEREPLPVPDCSDSHCSLQLSAMCILIHILRKAQSDNLKTPQSLPPAFTGHHELLQNLVHNPQVPLLTTAFPAFSPPDYRIALLLNAYSTNSEVFHRPMWGLTELIFGNQKTTVPMPGTNCQALGSTTPFHMSFLDSLTIHVKMNILHNISTHINKHSHSKSNIALAPALVETYARLLVYSETESLGIKQYINQLLPVVFKNTTWGILHALLEMFIHRIHHSPPQYRIQLLSTIHHMAIHLNTISNMHQLHICMENSALRLITGLGNTEVMPNLMRFFTTEAKSNVISAESEELNRVIVLTMARAIHVTGCDSSGESARWCVDFLKAVMSHTPHTWASHTLQCFPSIIADFYKQHGAPRDTQNLKKAVEEEYRKWKSMSNENDIIAHFSLQHNTSNLFLCIVFKIVYNSMRVPAETYKILKRLGPSQLMVHVRTLCDFLVQEFSHNSLGTHQSKCVDTINSMIWQFNIVPIDRFILCLCLRTQERNNEVNMYLLIIQLLLVKPSKFRDLIQEFVSNNSPEHWKQTNWYEKHTAFHKKFPEKFAPESLTAGQDSHSSQYQTLPIYFSNVCLRFLPVLDIMIHRFIEFPQAHTILETVFEQLGSLYKFHDRPFTYLYNTLHYYEEQLRDSLLLKKNLVRAVVMSQKDIRPAGWALTEEYIIYLGQNTEERLWNPSLPYYVGVVKRLVQTIQGKSVFPHIEWRFNEFANCGAHALHVTCVELMALPSAPSVVASNLVDTLLKGFKYCEISPDEVMDWVNALGLIFSRLPKAYYSVIHDKIVGLMQIPDIASPTLSSLDPFKLLNLQLNVSTVSDCVAAMTLALVHSFWHHASFDQISKIPQLMKERLRPMLKTEEQLIVLCHVVAPFLQRFNTEVGKKLFEVPLELYEALAVVDKCASEMKYQDAICDLLYHIKYMFTGDTIKNDIEDLIKSLRPSLKLRLRFITHLSIEDIESITSTTTNATITIPTTSTPTTSNNKSNDSRTSTTTLGSEPFAHEELAIPGPSTESIDISIAESKKRSHSDDSDDDRKRKCNCGGRSDDSNSYIKEQKKLSEDLIKITNLSSNKICGSIEEGVQILATQLKRIADILEKKQT